MNLQEAFEIGFDAVKAYVDDAFAAFERRLAAVEARKPVDGKDADPAVIARMVADAVGAIPKPVDGRSITLDEVVPMIEAAVARAVAALPRAKDGVGLAGAVIDRSGALIITLSDGTARNLGHVVGSPGKDAVLDPAFARSLVSLEVVANLGDVAEQAAALVPKPQDGKSVTVDDVRPMVEDVAARIVSEAKAMVRNYVDSRPLPENGKNATPEQIADAVAAYLKANPPEPGESIKGDQGRGIADLLIDAGGNLVATFTDGSTKAVGRVVGRDGADAKGKDGISIMRAGINPVGELCIHLTDESILNVGRVVGKDGLPGLEDHGVYKAGTSYERGNVVTWDGSAWVCQEPTTDKPATSKAWRMLVRKGQDGKDGKDAPRPSNTTPFGEK